MGKFQTWHDVVHSVEERGARIGIVFGCMHAHISSFIMINLVPFFFLLHLSDGRESIPKWCGVVWGFGKAHGVG